MKMLFYLYIRIYEKIRYNHFFIKINIKFLKIYNNLFNKIIIKILLNKFIKYTMFIKTYKINNL